MASTDDGPNRIHELLRTFLAETEVERLQWIHARDELSGEVRVLTGQLLDTLEQSAPRDPALIESVPHLIAEALDPGFLDVFGDAGPPRLPVVGDDVGSRERRRRVVALLRMALETSSRAEALEVLGRLEASRNQIAGLGGSFLGWLHLLEPSVFPPLPNAVMNGSKDALAGSGGIVDTARKIWALADAYADELGGGDLAVPAAFLAWIGRRGPDAMAQRGPEFYGLNRFVHETLLSATFVERLEADVRVNRLLLFTGHAGTGKTHTAVRFLRYLTRDGGEARCVRVHPGLDHEALVGTADRPGLLVELAERARKDPAGTYAVLLDDLESLDVRAALGELTLAFEFPGESVWLGAGRRFSVPDNLLIVGTSNRGQEDLLGRSYPFFRRFSYVDFEPDARKLSEWLQRTNNPVRRFDIVHAFRNLNRILRQRTGGRFMVGHGYLMVEGLTDDNVTEFWNAYVLPYVRSHLVDTTGDVEVYRLARLL